MKWQYLPIVALALVVSLPCFVTAAKTGLGITDFERNETIQVGEIKEISTVAYVFNTGDVALTLISQWIPEYANDGIFVTVSPNITDLLPDKSVPISITVIAQNAGVYTGIVEFSYMVIKQGGPKTTVGGGAHVVIHVPRPAEFHVNSLDAPETALLDETVAVNVTVSNIGDLEGDYWASLDITAPDGKTSLMSTFLTLAGNTTYTASFGIPLEQVGLYQLEIANYTHSINVTAPLKPAQFIIESFDVSDSEVFVGETVQANVTVTNIGDLPDYYTATLSVTYVPNNNSTTELSSVSPIMHGDDSTTFVFEITFETVGDYHLKTGNLIHTLTVKPHPDVLPIILIGSVSVAAIGLLGSMAVVICRRRKKQS